MIAACLGQVQNSAYRHKRYYQQRLLYRDVVVFRGKDVLTMQYAWYNEILFIG